ncbi:MAG: HPP family protein [gamma proteobacterium symbiont of Bathyaustriella thionipta]|nr:HPP family protein [gamma proteobacterium symbiont of Bathyaustriella thionipta]
MNYSEFLAMIGFSRHKTIYKEKVISGVGGFLGIFAIFMVSYSLFDPQTAVYIVPSMGASAVLLFAAPHVPFSQPWNVFGGHIVSAFVGVACWQLIPDYTLAASASVGIAISVMYLLRCTHPPGGATALAAVIGGEKLHQLGYGYVYEPILFNTLTILLLAITFNALFKWRQYPAHLPCKKKSTDEPYSAIKHEDFVYALSHMDTFVDIDEEDLLKIYQLATSRTVDSDNK